SIAPVVNGTLPKVVVIVPGYNEQLNAVKTIESLLNQDYSSLQVCFVDDGSTDNTYDIVRNAFINHPAVSVHTKMNGGKASALNYGIAMSDSKYLICIDADTQLAPDAVSNLMQAMLENENVGAVAGTVKVGNEVNLLTRWQSIEYITAQNFDRRALDQVNGITVVPGAIGAFRKQAVIDAGGFTSDTLAEDCDLTIRILKSGYRVVNCPAAIAVTEAPETLKQFMKQRFRWSYGIMQSFWKNRAACFRLSYKGLGMVSLPNLLIFQICLPLLAPLADLMLIFGIFWNRGNTGGNNHMVLYYISFLVIDLLISIVAFRFEKLNPWKLVWLIPQRFVYRQLMYVIIYRAINEAIKGKSQGWGVLQRSGRAQLST
ncbi:MAG TPA: glycosyltransferase, partial [Flavitalea sp.]|nr:glycosyltransferase [Flavitalea sp.]